MQIKNVNIKLECAVYNIIAICGNNHQYWLMIILVMMVAIGHPLIEHRPSLKPSKIIGR